MKKHIIILSTLCSLNVVAQHTEHHSCGFDHYVKHHENSIQKTNNSSKKQGGGSHIFNKYSKLTPENQTLSTNSPNSDTHKIYEIPVVVHLIESEFVGQITDNRTLKLSDEQIKTWIEDTNKMFAATYFKESGQKSSVAIPFKLVLAKRDKDLKPTTGIFRHNGDHIQGYGLYGVRNSIDDPNYGPSASDIVREFPHWQEDLYYNIYVVVGVDGFKGAQGGAAGFAGLPSFGDNGYHLFVTAARVTSKGDVFLAHEFGHSLGLLHPFHGGSASACPTGNNDGVDDTEPIKSFACFEDAQGNCIRAVNEDDINPCTNTKYQGTQYNIMGYSYEPRKFTEGQREKVLQEFFRNDRGKKLVKSRGGEAIIETSEITLKNACIPKDFRFEQFNTTRNITFGDIESNAKNNAFYTNYTTNSGLRKGSYTDLIENKAETLTIQSERGNKFHAWIDYNNNGTFENNERITPASGLTIPANGKASLSITPMANAVKDTYLRLRILTDEFADTACTSDFLGGNINDFAVRIVEEKLPEPEPEVEPISEPVIPSPTPDPNPSPQTVDYTGRVGINTAEPKATLDIRATPINELPNGQTQGVLFPSFTTEERSKFQNVEEGTMIFNTTLKCLEVYKGAELKWQCIINP